MPLVTRSVDLSVTNLPPLKVAGRPMWAHTQGIEWVNQALLVTARREDETRREPLLLRTRPGADRWDVWNLAATASTNVTDAMNHPGGFQFDGKYLWIPLAESRRTGHSVIRVLDPRALKTGVPVPYVREIPVPDHIGALAVATERNRVLGASWDTATVWVWDLHGTFVERIPAGRLRPALLGVDLDSGAPAGLTVQDWKWHEGKLLASGLWKDGLKNGVPQESASGLMSRLALFDRIPGLDATQPPRWVELPQLPRGELAREGMAVADGRIWFLPGDLGATNQLFSIPEPR